MAPIHLIEVDLLCVQHQDAQAITMADSNSFINIHLYASRAFDNSSERLQEVSITVFNTKHHLDNI